jgi:transposase
MRAAMNAILYLLRTGCPWRHLPHDGFPPRSTVCPSPTRAGMRSWNLLISAGT